ncbi:capsular polysaccharide type 8 biosynthesis protein cap8A [Clostridium puniceum]|uniref:Capsular polysaccharide type 8 biosynthesis protein cap8A n=1 Tax=Clostridium puniceum TaxID=29367 RepID=A0A1S8TUY6_9CLOT|nr:Wzz/FepE/Etk N-terminal domain-containing protein [Clostridium puniceum]OOM81540.1 capsular polysaccharide type 8 biosynthesis protein cap8A [Clostridium puniceum]
MNEDILRIEDLIKILKRRWKMIVSITIISTIFSVCISFYVISPKYEASTKIFIGKENSEDTKYSEEDVNMYQKLLKTYVEIISTNDLVEKAINKEGLDITSEEVLKGLTIAPRTDTQILEIKYTSEDKILAKNVVDSITNEFIESSTEFIPNADIKIIEKVKMPKSSISPNKKMNIAIAFLLGLMISIGLSFLLDAINNTLKTKEELEQILNLPVIGEILNEL